jgi:hypothetical protein
VTDTNTALRAMHDVGLAAWFGGSAMGAAGLNPAAEKLETESGTARVASVGWKKWTPVNAVAIGVHLVGGAGLAVANWHRVGLQRGVLASTVAKTALTGLALAATAYARSLGKKIEVASSLDNEGSPEDASHHMAIEAEQRKLRVVQWTVPALTGAIEILNALQGEQQRPAQQARGWLQRLLPA